MWQALDDIRHFLETGGPVLWLIGLTATLLAALIIERYWYFRFAFASQIRREVKGWCSRNDRHSWQALRIRDALISQANARLNSTLPLIKLLVSLCPLLGLLGTVTGMITVFDVMTYTGGGNARAMAAGVSMATVPTLAGMVAALSGVYFGSWLEHKAQVEAERLEDLLHHA